MSKPVFHNAEERNFSGDTASALYKSREEAPEVANYNYDVVENLDCGTGFTDLNAWDADRPLQTLHFEQEGTAGIPPPDALLNDAYLCVMIDDGEKLLICLNMLRDGHKIPFPADVMYGELFKDTLWNRISDPELNLPAKHRHEALELLSYFHETK